MHKKIDHSTLVIEGVDSKDYPDFCDAYVSAGQYTDGTDMSDSDLDEFNQHHPGVAQEMAFETLLT